MPFRPSYPGEVPTLGYVVLDWFEANLIVPDGPTAGDPLILTPEQAQFVLKFYSVDAKFDGDLGPIRGRSLVNARKVRRAVLSRPKGWGKSPLLAALCLAEAIAPVVLDGWDSDGQPVGRPWSDLGFKALVQCVATSEDQTANTWTPLLEMCRNGAIFDNYAIEPMESFINVPNGRVEAVTSSGRSREGFRPVFYVLDQTESWLESNGGHKLAGALRRNLGKVQGTSVETPNGFIPGEDSVAERSYTAWQKQIEGRLRGDTEGLYYDHIEMPPDTDTTDRERLKAGLAVAYGDSADVNGGWVSLDRVVDEYWDPDTHPQDAARYYGNQITSATDSWISQPEWAAALDADKVVCDGDAITLGFDGSRHRARGVADATALVGCRVSDGHVFELAVWEQPEGPSGENWDVPVLEVESAIAAAFDRYRVVSFFADPSKWETNVAAWEAKYGSKLAVKSTQSHPIEWSFSGNAATVKVVKALESFWSAVQHGELSHAGDFALTRHILNARIRHGRSGMTISKENPSSAKKIDAAMAAMMAWQARVQALAAGEGEAPKEFDSYFYRW